MINNKKISKKIETETSFKGVSRWVNQDTGEIIETADIHKKVSRNGFMITYLSQFIELMDIIGTKKLQVVKYILENMEKSNNTLIITTIELADKTNTSRQTVSDTLKLLEESGLIERRTGAIMINPKLIHQGTNQKEKYLLTKFEAFGPVEDGDSNEIQ